MFYDDPDVQAHFDEVEKRELRALLGNIQLTPGPVGERGERGETGPPGQTIIGPVGPRGEKGDSIKGDTGSQGQRGERGVQGEKGDQGDAGKDAIVDLDDVFETFVERIRKEKSIDISQVRNANSFIFGGKRYKIAELMHGGAGTTTAGKNVTTQYLLTAVQSGSDVTIALSQLTHFATLDTLIAVYRNNVPQTEGASYNFTATPTTVTIFGADASEIYNLTYSYS